MNWLWSSFELVGDRRLFTCSESVCPREHEGTERDTEGVGCDMS